MTSRKLYFVCSTQRSGSSAYCELLRNTKRLGWPREHFKVDRVRSLGEQFDQEAFAQAANDLLSERVTPNGVTGSKLHYHQMLELLEHINLGDLGPVHGWIYIDRQDVIGQAVSLVRAQQTNAFFSDSEEEVEPHYSYEAIYKQLKRLTNQKRGWELFFAGCQIDPLRVTYEELLIDPAPAVQGALSILGLDPAIDDVDLHGLSIGVQRDALNEEWRRRFTIDFRRQYGLGPPQQKS